MGLAGLEVHAVWELFADFINLGYLSHSWVAEVEKEKAAASLLRLPLLFSPLYMSHLGTFISIISVTPVDLRILPNGTGAC